MLQFHVATLTDNEIPGLPKVGVAPDHVLSCDLSRVGVAPDPVLSCDLSRVGVAPVHVLSCDLSKVRWLRSYDM